MNTRVILPLEMKRTSITRLKQDGWGRARVGLLTWNEKNLDYEIETGETQKVVGITEIYLKWKEPRLRDWNCKWSCSLHRCSVSLKWKEPRLRDWNSEDSTIPSLRVRLEMKRTSITRLKLVLRESPPVFAHLKWKEPRLRDWNWPRSVWYPCRGPDSWNEKNLDYEIETSMCASTISFCSALKWKEPRLRDWNHHGTQFVYRAARLEMKRTSITRLKLRGFATFAVVNFPWNEKNLDYEIETSPYRYSKKLRSSLEMKRTSITRLKREPYPFPIPPAWSWNEKNLDYEIETGKRFHRWCLLVSLEMKRTSITRLKLNSPSISARLKVTWNEKNLDYEIETILKRLRAIDAH